MRFRARSQKTFSDKSPMDNKLCGELAFAPVFAYGDTLVSASHRIPY
jgi:hypothetical protein